MPTTDCNRRTFLVTQLVTKLSAGFAAATLPITAIHTSSEGDGVA